MILSAGAAHCQRASAYSGTCSRLMRAAAAILPPRSSTNRSPALSAARAVASVGYTPRFQPVEPTPASSRS